MKSSNENIIKFRDYLNDHGIVATINQRLDFETASIIIEELGISGVKLEKKNNSFLKGWG